MSIGFGGCDGCGRCDECQGIVWTASPHTNNEPFPEGIGKLMGEAMAKKKNDELIEMFVYMRAVEENIWLWEY
jgi:hypothetical protein